MKRKVNYQILIIILLSIILIVMCFFYFKEDSENGESDNGEMFMQEGEESASNTVDNTNVTTSSIKATSEIISALTENIQLHSTYYLQESYVKENQELFSGENMVSYTNGTYLVAPYNCVVTKINIPNVEEKCTQEHYIQISSTNQLAVKLTIDESMINQLSIGQEAKIQISAFEDKTLTGNITNISSTASNGKFTVTIEFENDGEVKIGMTANIVIEG